MSARIKADGDTWRAELADDGDDRIIVFFCSTTDQRPYRVVRLDHDRFSEDEPLGEISEGELRALFDASQSMGAPIEYPKYDR